MGFRMFDSNNVGRLVTQNRSKDQFSSIDSFNDIAHSKQKYNHSGVPYQPINAVISAERDPCPPGSREVYLGKQEVVNEWGDRVIRDQWDCVFDSPLRGPGGAHGRDTEGSGPVITSPFAGNRGGGGGGGKQSSGVPHVGRNKDEYHEEDELARSLMIEQLKNELHFVDCNPMGKRMGSSAIATSTGCCCEEEDQIKVAAIMHDLLRRKIFDQVPWMRDCLLHLMKSVEICCSANYDADRLSYGGDTMYKYENIIMQSGGMISLWKDKLITEDDSWLGEWYLASALLRRCAVYPYDIEINENISLDMDILFGLGIDERRLCGYYRSLASEGDDCEDDSSNKWIVNRFFALNVCTGEVKRLLPDPNIVNPTDGATIDFDGPTIRKYKIPTPQRCYELQHPGEGFIVPNSNDKNWAKI